MAAHVPWCACHSHGAGGRGVAWRGTSVLVVVVAALPLPGSTQARGPWLAPAPLHEM